MENSTNDNNTHSSTNQSLYTAQTIEALGNGLVNMYKPSLEKTKELLLELTNKQSLAVEQLHNENLSLAREQYSIELQEVFNVIKTYNAKLLHIKRNMRSLHDRTAKLKKRALRLEQHQEQALYVKAVQKETELKREQGLIAKASTSNDV